MNAAVQAWLLLPFLCRCKLLVAYTCVLSCWCDFVHLSLYWYILGPAFKNYLHAGLKCTPFKFDGDTKLGGAVDFLRGGEALQRDLDKLEGWAIPNCMKCNKCWILHLGQGNPGSTYRLGDVKQEEQSHGKGSGGSGQWQVEYEPAACPGSQKCQTCLGFSKHSIAGWLREGIVSLFSVLVWPHLEHCAQFWVAQYKTLNY